ncbi:SMI1/KNR4 family protein [Streptomyces sp. NPDC048241]|uniref:SMI1/KNR4 family protein n=1 Tax=Streptomyces sp. NPDC048241 TaxID=3365521 RepID=UPI003718ABD6
MTESPLTEAEVAEAERELGVSFPEDYGAYLREVSAGGALFRRLRHRPCPRPPRAAGREGHGGGPVAAHG